MSRKIVHALLATLVFALVAVSPVFGQSSSSGGGSRSVFDLSSSDPFYPQASEWGLTGLWKVISAETPPAKSFGASGWYDRINRNPGGLTISSAGSSGFVALSSRVELGLQVVFNRRTLSRRMDQLGFGQATLYTLGYSGGCPSCPILLAPVFMPGTAIPQLRNTQNNVLSGRTGYYPLLPYVNRRLQTGMGEVVISGKVNLASEARGASASVAIRPWISIPTHRNTTDLFNVGSQLGQVASGIDLLVSKNVNDVADVHFNVGVAFFPDAKRSGITYVSTPNMMPLRFGFNMPRTSRLQVLGEVTAEPFVGSQTPNTSFGSASPVDATIGLRGFLRPWLAFSAGYRGTLNQFGGDKNGFVAVLSASNLPVAPVAVPVPPTLTCSANPTRGTPGTMVRLTANASTTTGRTLNYAWTSPADHIEGSGPEVRFDTTGLTPGNYTATVRVNDGAEGFADCTVTVTVVEPPRPNPPTATCSVDRGNVTQGEPVTFSVTAGNPDKRTLSYQWRVSGGRLEGAGTRVRLDTTTLAPGTYTATVRVSDDRGLTADCSSSTNVVAPPAKPVMSKLNQCSFKVKTSRVDNVCKAVLDDVALRLQSDPDASSVVVGYATAKEPKAATLSAQRASNVKQYLVKDKGIAAGRVQVRSTSNGASQVEIYLVPRGAQYTGPGQVVTENATPEKPARRKAPAAKKTTEEKPAAPAAKPAAPAPAAKPAASAPAAKPAAAPAPAAKPTTPAPAAKPAASAPAPAAKPTAPAPAAKPATAAPAPAAKPATPAAAPAAKPAAPATSKQPAPAAKKK